MGVTVATTRHPVQDSLSAMLNEALVEIVEECLAKPGKILATCRYIKNDTNFVVAQQPNDDFIHSTIVYLDGVSKAFWIDVLVAYAQQKGGELYMHLGSEELVKAFDKSLALRGAKQLVCLLGHLSMKDSLPKHAHYKPLLRQLVLERFEEQNSHFEFNAEGAIDFCKCGVYEFAGPFTRVPRNPNQLLLSCFEGLTNKLRNCIHYLLMQYYLYVILKSSNCAISEDLALLSAYGSAWDASGGDAAS